MTIFRSGWTLALLVAIFAVAAWIGGVTNPWDIAANTALLKLRLAHPGLTQFAIAVTFFGSAYATIGFGLLAALWLVVRRRLVLAGWLAGGIALERLSADGLKLLFDRPRPNFDLPAVATSSSSFPSGHSANSLAIYLMIALTLAPARYRVPAVLAASAMGIAAGLTRPFLGVHWPTDVIGGWALALIAVWIFLWAGSRSGARPFEQ
ncbi:phosphatase PAP2 family protein [Sphingomonas jaspsi]|uniref:phosphatase PAP2 family protein n=1 Tax=Sphingomonas jaspsi TaxID=392409 RepID=UPI0004AE7577|nr:phosphatase PAP2 family protein [Sphingomonas jaspsi]